VGDHRRREDAGSRRAGNPLRAPAMQAVTGLSDGPPSDWWYAGSRRSICEGGAPHIGMSRRENETTLVIRSK